MNRPLKALSVIACVFAVACLAGALYLLFHASPGSFNVTVNHQQVGGPAKVLVASAGLVFAAVAVVFALVVAALAVVGSGLVVFAALALTALILIAVAIPFLLPLALPVILIVFVLMLTRRPPAKAGS